MSVCVASFTVRCIECMSTILIMVLLHSFNPDRFAPHTSHARRGLEFCPFGTPGQRKCPGYVFSHFETTVMVSILIRQFQLVPIPGQVVERDYGLVTMPKNEIYITVEER